jgi:hypothetical protein
LFKEVTARLHGWSGSADTNAATGLMVRSSTADNAASFMVKVSMDGSVGVFHRDKNGGRLRSFGGWAQSYPTWLRIVRDPHSDTFTGYYSLDLTDDVTSVTWTELGSKVIDDFNGTYLVGTGSSGGNDVDFTRGEYSQIEMDFYDVCDVTCCSSQNVGVNDGSGWNLATIGTVNDPQPEVQRTGSTFDMCYTGGNIWKTNDDDFPFVYQEIDIRDLNRITVRLQDVTGSGERWARLGPMVRDSLDQNAAHYMARYLPNYQNGSMVAQYRTNSGASADTGTYVENLTPPQWMRIEVDRVQGSRVDLTWSYSVDGANWTQGTDSNGDVEVVTLDLEDRNVLVGIAVTSRDNATESWATFDNVTIE